MRPATALSKTEGVWASDTAVDGEQDYWLNRMQFFSTGAGPAWTGNGWGAVMAEAHFFAILSGVGLLGFEGGMGADDSTFSACEGVAALNGTR